MPRAQQTPSAPAPRARQGLVPGPAESPSSSQEGEMSQVFRKQSTAWGSPRKRTWRIWSKISTIKVTRLFTATTAHFSQDIYVCARDSHPPHSGESAPVSVQDFKDTVSIYGEDHKPLTLFYSTLSRQISLCLRFLSLHLSLFRFAEREWAGNG